MEKSNKLLRKLIVNNRIKISHIFLLIVILFAKPKGHSIIIGVIFLALGESIRIWSAGYIQKSTKLATYGPYYYVRNPLYLGSFLIGIGMCIYSRNLFLTIIYFIIFPITYYLTIIDEEKILKTNFGEQYEEYLENVPCFIPKIRKSKSNLYKDNEIKWDIKMLFKNKEYEGIIWIIIVFLIFLSEFIIFKGTKNLFNLFWE